MSQKWQAKTSQAQLVLPTFISCEIGWHGRLWFCPSSALIGNQLEHEAPEKLSFLFFLLCWTSHFTTWSFISPHHSESLYRLLGWGHAIYFTSSSLTLVYFLFSSFTFLSFTNTSLHLFFVPSLTWLHPLHTITSSPSLHPRPRRSTPSPQK